MNTHDAIVEFALFLLPALCLYLINTSKEQK
jgi:hypothetical protein